MNNIPQTISTAPAVGFEHMPIEAMKRQVQLIQQAMKDVMQDGTHYGKIPGCGDKPTLLKPGAEKICLLFGLRTSFQVEERRLENNHREYYVVCSLQNRESQVVGQGVGTASTMEAKYRWRHTEAEPTERGVPGQYWDAKKRGDIHEMQELLGGPEFVAKKIDGTWTICKKGEGKVENPDVADVYNTILKMAKKRAHVDATLTTTAASDIFTQDLEDIAPQQEVTPKKERNEKAAASLNVNKNNCYVYNISEAREQVSVSEGKRLLSRVLKANAGIMADEDGVTVLYSDMEIPEWERFLLQRPSNPFTDGDDLPPDFGGMQ